jgi:uncharacterized membrane-anchored protein YjiN (DUF445 family)
MNRFKMAHAFGAREMRPAESGADAARRTELSRMRLLATGLLALMTVIFVATRMAPRGWVWTDYVGAFAEAAMVGACADWFAVTALFRHPFGLPIPHTGIIPRNKDKIGEALGDFIANNFLTPRVLDRRLRALKPAERLADWLSRPENVERVAQRAATMLPELAPSGTTLRDFVGEIALRAARAGPAAPLAARILSYVWNEAGGQGALDRLITWAAAYLAEHDELIEENVARKSWKWLPKFIDRALAERITAGLMGALEEVADPDHPWRAEIKARVDDLIRRLAEDPEMLARGEVLKERILTDPAFRRRLRAMWSDFEASFARDPQALGAVLAPAAARALTGLGRWLDEESAARDRLDTWIRVAVRRTLAPRRQAIGAFVAQVVAGWDAGEAVEKLELQVGRDLQFIRVNGTLVGGLVGLAIFTLTRLLGGHAAF